MPFIIPQIVYPASAPANTLSFTYPPTEKPGIDDLAAVREDSITISGLKQSLWERNDVLKRLHMENVPMVDLPNWKAFMDSALQGNSFLYYPDVADLSSYDEWWLEDSGGSAPSASGGSVTDVWSPTFNVRGLASFDLVFRKVPGGISSGTP